MVLEAMLVATITTISAFLLIFIIDDCQPLGKDPNAHPLQVIMCYKPS